MISCPYGCSMCLAFHAPCNHCEARRHTRGRHTGDRQSTRRELQEAHKVCKCETRVKKTIRRIRNCKITPRSYVNLNERTWRGGWQNVISHLSLSCNYMCGWHVLHICWWMYRGQRVQCTGSVVAKLPCTHMHCAVVPFSRSPVIPFSRYAAVPLSRSLFLPWSRSPVLLLSRCWASYGKRWLLDSIRRPWYTCAWAQVYQGPRANPCVVKCMSITHMKNNANIRKYTVWIQSTIENNWKKPSNNK